ncbi:MAG: ADOP family duplicated permease, partial [Vicinamibacteraceae bacterium]
MHYALRGLGRTPGFTAVAILTLALGIGANTAIFSVINGVFLTPLPFDDSDRVVTLVANEPAAESDRGAPSRDSGSITVAELTELRSRATTLSHVAFAGMPTLMTMSGRGETKHLEGMDVSPGIFAVLGVPAMLGRTFGADEEALGQDRVILLSYAAWQRDFGADPDVLGESVVLSSSVFGRTSETYAIIGVMPDGFEFDNGQKQFWTPTTWEPDSGGVMVARLADGVSLQAASAEINAMLRAIRKDRQATTYELVRWQDEIAEPVKPALLVLTLAVGCVLLIACANVANLLLARSATRQREIAIRIALGAGRARMVRQLLTESVVLALLGGAGGAAFAYGGIRLLRSLATTLGRMDLGFYLPFPRLDAIGLDVSVLAFTAAASLVAGLLIGLAPAARYARPDQAEVLREGTSMRITISGGSTAAAAWGFGLAGRGGVRGLLVVAQIAMALTLLAAGALLVRSFVALSRVDAGYDPTNVLTFQVALPHERYPNARLEAFAEDLVGRLRLLPAVERAGYARQLPMVVLRDTMTFERRPIGAVPSPHSRDDTDRPSADLRLVSRDYLEAMGMRVIAGRAFTEADRAGRPRVVVINRALARRYFPRENPLGTTIGTSFGSFEIIGIVDDVRQFGLDAAPTPQYFVDYRQWPDEADAPPVFPLGPYYTVRPAASPASFTAAVRRIARELDEEAGLYNVATMEQIVSNSTYRPRLYATLLGIFAGVGVCVAAIGLYGVMA